MSRYRAFVFTHNNYTEENILHYRAMDCKYMVAGKEVGKNGTPHLQGYVEYSSACTLSAAIKRLKPAHVEIRMATAEKADQYCRKGEQSHEEWEEQGIHGPNYGKNVDIAVETGSLGPGQGKRTELDDCVESVMRGDSLTEIAQAHPKVFMKYHRGIEALHLQRMEPRTDKPTIEWRWGLAGRGKTYHVMQKHGAENIYIKDGTKWWNDYAQQEVILIDDFDGAWPFRDFLRVLDRYAYQGQFKGGYVHINSAFIYITCEYPPNHFWSGNELEQVTSRIDSIVEVKGPNRRVHGGGAAD